MASSPASLVVHSQPHRSRYRLRDSVKCHVSLHTVRPLDAPPNAKLPLSAASDGAKAKQHVMVPFDQSRLCAETTRSSSSQSSLMSSVVTVHSSSIQLVAYCCWDRKKLTITDDAMRKVGRMPVAQLEANGNSAAPQLAAATREQLHAPEVLGRNENVTVQHLSNIAKPFSGARLHLGETLTAAVTFVLPPIGLDHNACMMPSYRGHSLRTSFMVVVSVTWSASFTATGLSAPSLDSSSAPSPPANATVTTIRFPLRVHAPECILPGRLSIAPLFSSDDDDDDVKGAAKGAAPVAPLPDDDGAWVILPATASPALCPPLHDSLVQEVSQAPHNRAHMVSDQAGGVPLEGNEAAATPSPSSTHSVDTQLRQGVAASTSCSGPTDYIIRCLGVHVMNFFLETTVVTLGGCLCGSFISVPGASMRVARVSLSIDSVELVGKPFVAKGASVTSAVPDILSATVPAHFPERVPVQAHTVEEREWYVLDAQHMPLEVCLSPMKFQQTIRSPLASLEWVARWRFWCVEALPPGHINVQKRPIKEMYQELELPITICPPREGAAAARMGPITIGV